jgi:hypothetical protein
MWSLSRNPKRRTWAQRRKALSHDCSGNHSSHRQINRVDRGIIRTFEVGIDCSPTIDWSRQVNTARTLKRIIAGALL